MPIAGSTSECTKHLFGTHPEREFRDFAADFIGVNELAVRRWVGRDITPTGLNLVRLQFMLEQAGYTVWELRSLPEDNQKLARLIALGVVTIEETYQSLDYASEKGMYDLLIRGHTCMPSKTNALERLIKSNLEAGQTALEEFQARLQAALGQTGRHQRQDDNEPDTPVHDTSNGVVEMGLDRLKELVANMHRRIQALEQEIASEQTAHAETRSKLEAATQAAPTIKVDGDLAQIAERYLDK